jgi:threonine dehydrogenase-like Zn-dependent dehydrogenase
MRAAILREYGEPLDIHEVPDPEPGPDGAVVRVTACGVCRSDWHAWAGHGEWADDRVPRGQVLGHEPAGEVVTVGDSVDRFAPGDRVVVPNATGNEQFDVIWEPVAFDTRETLGRYDGEDSAISEWAEDEPGRDPLGDGAGY